jgi:hypothetical protein
MSKDLPESQPSEEVDLGQLFKLIGRAFDRFFNFIGSILNKFFLAFVWMVFFTKKHFLKIALAGILGFAYGFIRQKTKEPVYKSATIIKQNYKTGENLYLLIDFYNALISEGDSITLAYSLQISPPEANLISGFGVESTLNENQKLKLFDNYKKEMDSVLASTLEFKTFINNSNEFDYELQKITLKAYSKDIFKKVLAQVIENVESSEFIKNEQIKDLTELDRRESAIKQSLTASDSLQKVYQRVLEKSVEKTLGSQTSVTIDNTEDKSITKEFELYNSDLELRRELVTIQRERDDIQNIIEIITSEQNEGTLDNSQDVLGLSISKMIFGGLFIALLVFMVLLLLEALKFLQRYKSKIQE